MYKMSLSLGPERGPPLLEQYFFARVDIMPVPGIFLGLDVSFLHELYLLHCPLGTAALSLKFENVVPGRWVCSFSYCGQLLFHCSVSMSSTSTRTCGCFSKSLRCTR